jgi:hypothetical protein
MLVRMPKRLLLSLAALLLSARSSSAVPAPPSPRAVETRVTHDVAWFQEALKTTDPKCAAAVDGLNGTAQLWASDPARGGNEEERAYQATRRAMQAGCTDARVLYVNARMYDIVARESTAEAARLAVEAAAMLDRSDVRPMLKVAGHVRAAQRIIADARARKATSAPGAAEQLASAAAIWPRVANDAGLPQTLLMDVFQAFGDSERDILQDRRTAAAPILASFARNAVATEILEARLGIDLAWDARGNKFAEKTSASSQTAFESRLAEAEKHVAKLAKLDPASPATAQLMLAVLLGGEGDTATMEAWFRFGLAVDPGNSALWYARLHHLEPRWHGSPEEMLAVGHEALASKQWAIRVPFLLIFAHFQLAENDATYFDDADVCKDVHAVYDPYLQKYPDASYERSGFARLLYLCHDLTGANREIKRLGADRRLGPFETKATFDKIKVEAALNAK